VGARHVVITDVNDYRLELCNQVNDAVTVNVSKEDLRDVMHKLGMQEGFDIGLEMSGAPNAFDQMVDHMIMGGKIAILGIPFRAHTGGLEPHHLQVAHPQGHLWPRDVRDLVQDDRHAAIRPRRAQGDHPPLQGGYAIETGRQRQGGAQGFALMKQGFHSASGKVVLDWGLL
jgi:threonine dehydrogenase-like Zn-dependent dehydrogenase